MCQETGLLLVMICDVSTVGVFRFTMRPFICLQYIIGNVLECRIIVGLIHFWLHGVSK
jgi:hypothetical protein